MCNLLHVNFSLCFQIAAELVQIGQQNSMFTEVLSNNLVSVVKILLDTRFCVAQLSVLWNILVADVFLC